MPVDPSLCVAGNYRGDAAYEATKPLMTRADRPTAIIGANNVMALGALAGDPRSRIQLPGRCLAGRHRRRAVERTCAAARHDRRRSRSPISRRRRSPACSNGCPMEPRPTSRRATWCSSRISCPAIHAPRRVQSRSSRRADRTRSPAAMAKPCDDGPATGSGESPVSLAGARRHTTRRCDAQVPFSALPASPMIRAIRRHS